MSTKIVQSRVKDELKTRADDIFNQIGITTAEAIRMFLQQVVNVGGLPFTPRIKQPNKETLQAIQELEDGKGKKFSNLDDFNKSLGI